MILGVLRGFEINQNASDAFASRTRIDQHANDAFASRTQIDQHVNDAFASRTRILRLLSYRGLELSESTHTLDVRD